MAKTESSDEVRANYIASMGEELGQIFSVLANELALLSWQFQELSELYGERPERLNVMNASAPFFFWLVQRTWWDECLLGITRLVAPKESRGKANLTVVRLPDLIDDPALAERVEGLVKAVTARVAFASVWRNKRIAHRDLDHSLDRAPEPLPPAKLDDVADVLADLAQVLNEVERHYMKATTTYRHSPITRGVVSLLYVVRDGLRREAIRQKHLEDGTYEPEEWDDDAPAL